MSRGFVPHQASDSKAFRATANRTRKVNGSFFVPRGGTRF